MNAFSTHHCSFEKELDTKHDDVDDSDGYKFDRDIFTEERDMMSNLFHLSMRTAAEMIFLWITYYELKHFQRYNDHHWNIRILLL